MITVLFPRVRVRWRKCARFWKRFKHLLRHIPPVCVERSSAPRAFAWLACCVLPATCAVCLVACDCLQTSIRANRGQQWRFRHRLCQCAKARPRGLLVQQVRATADAATSQQQWPDPPPCPILMAAASAVVSRGHPAPALSAVLCGPWVSDTARQRESRSWPIRQWGGHWCVYQHSCGMCFAAHRVISPELTPVRHPPVRVRRLRQSDGTQTRQQQAAKTAGGQLCGKP